ncbi:MAG: hypothetical protein JNK64_18685 [Myxococcales bacterium]|nr:hypothetical protein [Myxococcales bacterium]
MKAALATALVIGATAAAQANPVMPSPDDCLELDAPPRGIACIRRPPPPPPPPPPPVEIVAAPPLPPATPAPPRWQSFGFRTGVEQLATTGHTRLAFNYGLAWGVALAGRLHAYAEYDFVMVASGDTMADGTREDVHGHGHALGAGVRFPLATTLIGRADDVSGTRLRPHVDLELGGAGLLVSEDRLGSYLVPQAVVGARLGLELVRAQAAGSLRPGTADIYMTVRATGTPEAVTWAFAMGMDWGG